MAEDYESSAIKRLAEAKLEEIRGDVEMKIKQEVEQRIMSEMKVRRESISQGMSMKKRATPDLLIELLKSPGMRNSTNQECVLKGIDEQASASSNDVNHNEEIPTEESSSTEDECCQKSFNTEEKPAEEVAGGECVVELGEGDETTQAAEGSNFTPICSGGDSQGEGIEQTQSNSKERETEATGIHDGTDAQTPRSEEGDRPDEFDTESVVINRILSSIIESLREEMDSGLSSLLMNRMDEISSDECETPHSEGEEKILDDVDLYPDSDSGDSFTDSQQIREKLEKEALEEEAFAAVSKVDETNQKGEEKPEVVLPADEPLRRLTKGWGSKLRLGRSTSSLLRGPQSGFSQKPIHFSAPGTQTPLEMRKQMPSRPPPRKGREMDKRSSMRFDGAVLSAMLKQQENQEKEVDLEFRIPNIEGRIKFSGDSDVSRGSRDLIAIQRKLTNQKSFEKEEIEELNSEYSQPEVLERVKTVQRICRGWYGRRDYARLRKKYRRRDQILNELLETEEKYVKLLDVLQKLYVLPLGEASKNKDAFFSIKDVHIVFSNVSQIVVLNRELLSSLKERTASWTPATKIGDVFLTMAPYLKFYTQYCGNHEIAIMRIGEIIKVKPKFQKMIDQNKLHPEAGRNNLEDLLILPIQRIPRYKLLLDDFIKNTPKWHQDYDDLVKALALIKDVAEHVNEAFHLAEGMNKIIEIQKKVTGIFFNLLEPHRRFIYEGFLIKNGSSRTYFLFNDVLMWAQKSLTGSQHRYRGHLYLDSAWINDLEDEASEKNIFQLVTPEKTYKVSAVSKSEKSDWLSRINEQIDTLIHKDPTLMSKRAPVQRRKKRGLLYHLSSHSSMEKQMEKEKARMEVMDGNIGKKLNPYPDPKMLITMDEIFEELNIDKQFIPSSIDVELPKISRGLILQQQASGALVKQGASFTSWRQRHFVLKDKFLYYFREKKKEGVQASGMIPLSECVVMKTKSIKKKFAFQIHHPSRRDFYLVAKDSRQQEFWIEVISNALESPRDISYDGIELILSILINYPSFVHAQKQAAVQLERFTSIMENVACFKDIRILPIIFKILVSSEYEGILTHVTGTLLNICTLPEFSNQVLENSLYMKILLFRLFYPSMKVQGKVAATLTNLTCSHSTSYTFEDDKHPALPYLLTLATLSSIPQVKEAALQLLANVLRDDCYARTSLYEAGALPIFVTCLMSNESNLQYWSARALGYLARIDKNRKNIPKDVLDKLLGLLTSPDEFVTEQAAFAIKNLSIDDINRKYISENAGLPRLVSLLSSSRDELVLEAVQALRFFAATTTGKEALLDHGGLPPLIKALSSSNLAIQENTARTIANLTYNSTIEEHIRDLDGIKPFVNILMNVRVQEQGPLVEEALRALANLTQTDGRNKIFLLENGVMQALENILNSHLSSHVHLEQALILLAHLSETISGQDLARESGLLPTIISITSGRNYRWVVRVQALRALFHLVRQTTNRREILKHKHLPVLSDFMAAGELNPIVQEICKCLLMSVPSKEDALPIPGLTTDNAVIAPGMGNVELDKEEETQQDLVIKLKVRAEWKWDAESDEELDLEEGDVLTVYDQSDQEWWLGKRGEGEEKGKVGYFPSKYVSELKLVYEKQ